jgi:hypothetical protein
VPLGRAAPSRELSLRRVRAEEEDPAAAPPEESALRQEGKASAEPRHSSRQRGAESSMALHWVKKQRRGNLRMQ